MRQQLALLLLLSGSVVGEEDEDVFRGELRVRTDGQVFYFLHLHKSAGTSICNLAKVNKERFATNTLCSDPALRSGKVDTVAQQADYAEGLKNRCPFGGCNLVANEGLMALAMNWAVFWFATSLREPRARLASHFDHHNRHLQAQHRGTAKRRPSKTIPGMPEPLPAGSENGGETLLNWINHVPDNWMTRQICGRYCFGVPRGQLNISHVTRARDMLENFDAVLVVEALDESISLLKHALGWTDLDIAKYSMLTQAGSTNGGGVNGQVAKRDVSNDGNGKKLMAHVWGDNKTVATFTAEEIAAVERATSIDVDLYHYGAWLSAQQLRQLDRKQGGNGGNALSWSSSRSSNNGNNNDAHAGAATEAYSLKKHCTTPCCGKCHSNTFGLRRR